METCLLYICVQMYRLDVVDGGDGERGNEWGAVEILHINQHE